MGRGGYFPLFLLGNKLKETGEEGERRYVKESILTPLKFVSFFYEHFSLVSRLSDFGILFWNLEFYLEISSQFPGYNRNEIKE